MTDRCEPPPEWRDRDGWHELTDFDGNTVYGEWCANDDNRWYLAGYGMTYDAIRAAIVGFRYIAPVTPHAEVEPLRARVADLEELVRTAYSEGWGDGRRETDPLAAPTAGWNGSAARAAQEPTPAREAAVSELVTEEMVAIGCRAAWGGCTLRNGIDAVRIALAAVAPLIAAKVYEDCMAVARDFPIPDDAGSSEMHGRLMAGLGIASAIRARNESVPSATRESASR